MSLEDENKFGFSMQDAEDSLGGGPGSFAVEVYIAEKVYNTKHKISPATAKYIPSNLNCLEIEAEIARRRYESKHKRSSS